MAKRYKHIFLEHSGEQFSYTTPRRVWDTNKLPPRARKEHSIKLQRQLESIWQQRHNIEKKRKAVALPVREGTYLQFSSAPGYDLTIKSLEDLAAGIRLLNVQETGFPKTDGESTITRATVYVPSGKEGLFLKKINEYEHKDTDKGNPQNAKLIESIEDIRLAFLESFWQDDPKLMPGEESIWCEIWLLGHEHEIEDSFREVAQNLQIKLQNEVLCFPERTVILAFVNSAQLKELIESYSLIAEFRRAKGTPQFFLELENKDQTEWVEDLVSRISVAEDSTFSVTILDTGANNGHPLLAPLLADSDCHCYHPEWYVHDHKGHGTLMCGLTGYGYLRDCLESNNKINIPHCLESVKILPPKGENDPHLYGEITIQAVSRVEIQAPERIRTLCMAVSTEDGRDQGRPSSWSAAIDKLTSGYDDEQRRLFITCAGNIHDHELWPDYPRSNLQQSVHDPGQSWNALTVGAFTRKWQLTDPDIKEHDVVANPDSLSPFSTTSTLWETKKWPVKPDILLEGGNLLNPPDGFVSECDDLSILSLSYRPIQRQFQAVNGTSAATARASWMAAQIQSAYPYAWPETVRALLVHSARWPDVLKNEFLDSDTKTGYARLLRVAGYGVPDLDRALHCAANNLILIAQEEIQPFDKKGGSSEYRTKDMHIHELPWPREDLLALGEVPATLRITLSYFIEPSPGEVGWKDRYRYASHALRFDLNNPGEDRETFLQRLNKQAREDGERFEGTSGSERWLIGSQGRGLGSIHSDFWPTTAADLATCNLIGVYPVIGWWKERHWLKRWDKKTRYSLIVSIETPEQAVEQPVDLYTPVAVQLGLVVSG